MNRLKRAVLQATILLMAGVVISFVHNAVSINGINPFREVVAVPMRNGSDVDGEEGIRVVDLEGLDEAVAEGAVIIDARTRAEYEEGRIPGALLVDYYELGRYLKDLLPTLDPAQPTVVYCYGPDCEDAELLARELYMLGFTDLLVYEGGFEDWAASGREIEGGTAR